MKHIGINPIKVEGSKFETSHGYSKFVKLKFNNKTYTPIMDGIANTFGVKDHLDRINKKITIGVKEKEKYLSLHAKSSNIELSNPFIAGGSSIILGNSIWGPYSNFELGKIKDYKKLNDIVRRGLR